MARRRGNRGLNLGQPTRSLLLSTESDAGRGGWGPLLVLPRAVCSSGLPALGS